MYSSHWFCLQYTIYSMEGQRCYWQHSKMTETLIDHGADIFHCDRVSGNMMTNLACTLCNVMAMPTPLDLCPRMKQLLNFISKKKDKEEHLHGQSAVSSWLLS